MTDRYTVEISPSAARAMKKLDASVRTRIVAAIGLMRDNPRPPTMKALAGRPGNLRVRVGDYRIIYTIEDDRLIVLVLVVGHRRDVYRIR